MATTTIYIGTAQQSGTQFISLAAYNQSAGHSIVIVSSAFGNTGITKVTDTAGNSYHPVAFSNAWNEHYECWYAIDCLGNSSNVVTVQYGVATSFTSIFGYDIAGADIARSFSVIASGTNTSTTPAVTGTFNTPVGASVIVLNGVQSGYATMSTPLIGGTAATLDGQNGQGGNQFCAAHLDIASAQTGITASMAFAGIVAWGIAAVVFSSQPAIPPSFGYVQSNSQQDSGGVTDNTPSLMYSYPCFAGDLLFVAAAWLTNTATPTIADTAGSTWVALPIDTSQTCKRAAWYSLACKSTGTNIVTLTFATGTTDYVALAIDEWSSGVGGNFTLDAHAEDHGVNPTGPAALTINLTGNNDVVFGYEGCGYQTYAQDSGWAIRSLAGSAVTFLEDKLVSSSGNTTFTPHIGGSNSGAAGVAAFYGVIGYNISGTILDAQSNPMVGVTVACTGLTSTTTASDGTYSFVGATGSVTVTPSLTEWTFSPASKAETGADSAANFTGTETLYSISGNAGVGGATVSWTAAGTFQTELGGWFLLEGGGFLEMEGPTSGTVTADGSGNYTIPNLIDDTYTITPSKTGYTFAPVNSAQTVSGSSITGVNFTATQNVTGSSGLGFDFRLRF